MEILATPAVLAIPISRLLLRGMRALAGRMQRRGLWTHGDDWDPAIFAFAGVAVCSRWLGFVASKGQEKGNAPSVSTIEPLRRTCGIKSRALRLRQLQRRGSGVESPAWSADNGSGWEEAVGLTVEPFGIS
jgi:hypothetical protein